MGGRRLPTQNTHIATEKAPQLCGAFSHEAKERKRMPRVMLDRAYAALPSIRDHPRACGEHSVEGLSLSVVVGSSPRLRGTYHRILPDTAPPGNHSSQICLATRAESDICTYRGSHCSPASRSVFPHRERACADSGNSSIDEYPARVIPTPYFPRLNIPPLSTVYQANQAIGVGIPHAYRIQRLISAVPSS
ncbi:hypothetical protein PG2048B_1480 [Bifidobacterium pseudolongum subsp. globosum]|nr:hypothetical protein PG2048B_1480 [Bifidobacterium pseudolongum subsp. globosum]RYQ54604.1 hypothetical protein PG1578B_1336 [Bifidobacterium pseudolongum subsp. globosum]RYQ77310.1 hypothetical protein PG1577B_1337 [Bifidobacterium pseudolongum subsp. globosum]